jgi:hypothetical protein
VLASTIAPSFNTNVLTSSLYMLGSPVYWILGSPPISVTSIPRPAYHYILPLYILISILLYLISTRLVQPIRRWHLQWSEVLLAFVLVLGFISLVSLAFLATTNRYENIVIARTPTPPMVLPASAPEKITPTSLPEETESTPLRDATPTPEAFGWLSPESYLNQALPADLKVAISILNS